MIFRDAYRRSMEADCVPQSLVDYVITNECKYLVKRAIAKRRIKSAVIAMCAVFVLFFGAVIYGEMRPLKDFSPSFVTDPSNRTGIQSISFRSSSGEMIEAVYVTLRADDIAEYAPKDWDDSAIARKNVSWIKALQENEGVDLVSEYICVAFYEPGAKQMDKDKIRQQFSSVKTLYIDGFTVAVLRIS